MERSKGDRAQISETKAHEAILRTKIMLDAQSEAPSLMWGILPFVSAALEIPHSDTILLSGIFHEVSSMEPRTADPNLADCSWDQLAQHMRNSREPAQRALLYEVGAELRADPLRTSVSRPLYDRMVLLFPEILALLQCKLKNFANIRVVYGYQKGMGFRCRVSHIAGGGEHA